MLRRSAERGGTRRTLETIRSPTRWSVPTSRRTLLEHRPELGAHQLGALGEGRGEERALVAEVVVDRGLRDASPGGDDVHAGPLEPELHERLAGSRQDLAALWRTPLGFPEFLRRTSHLAELNRSVLTVNTPRAICSGHTRADRSSPAAENLPARNTDDLVRPIFRRRRASRPYPLPGVAASALALAALALASGCGRKSTAAAKPAGPVEVGVVTLAPTAVTLTQELPGRISAFRVAEVRARVNGIVVKRLFTEGSEVREGQPLFKIDPAPYQAALDSARAQLARAEARLASAKLMAERYTELVAANAVSKQEHDDAIAGLKTAEADVAAGRAAVQTARISLGYTTVTSP